MSTRTILTRKNKTIINGMLSVGRLNVVAEVTGSCAKVTLFNHAKEQLHCYSIGESGGPPEHVPGNVKKVVKHIASVIRNEPLTEMVQGKFNNLLAVSGQLSDP